MKLKVLKGKGEKTKLKIYYILFFCRAPHNRTHVPKYLLARIPFVVSTYQNTFGQFHNIVRTYQNTFWLVYISS